MDKQGVWKLSPAYDITYSYNPTGIWTSMHQMSINGKRGDFTINDLRKIGNMISYKDNKTEIQYIVDVVNNWKYYANKAGVPNEQANRLQKAFRTTW